MLHVACCMYDYHGEMNEQVFFHVDSVSFHSSSFFHLMITIIKKDNSDAYDGLDVPININP